MENEVLKFFIGQGAFAVLFIYLLYYVLDTNNKRELNYQSIIKELSVKFQILEIVCNDITDIKNILLKEGRKDGFTAID